MMIGRRKALVFTVIALMILMGTLVSACSGTGDTAAPSVEGSTGYETVEEAAPTAKEGISSESALDGRALLETRCTQCHDLGRVTNASKTAEAWEKTVVRMVGKGAKLNAEEQAVLIEYLSTTYP